MTPEQGYAAILGTWALRELYATFRDRGGELTRKLDALASELRKLELLVQKVEVQASYLHRDVSLIFKLEKDVNAAHGAIRDLRRDIPAPTEERNV